MKGTFLKKVKLCVQKYRSFITQMGGYYTKIYFVFSN